MSISPLTVAEQGKLLGVFRTTLSYDEIQSMVWPDKIWTQLRASDRKAFVLCELRVWRDLFATVVTGDTSGMDGWSLDLKQRPLRVYDYEMPIANEQEIVDWLHVRGVAISRGDQ